MSVEIIITNLTKVLSVPIQTVARLSGGNVCFVKQDARIVPVAVTTGWFNDAFVEIAAGLKEGDLVLLAPVGDKEESRETAGGETNRVEPAATPAPARAGEEPPVQGRGLRPGNSEATGGAAPPESPRPRPGSGRRSQNSQGAPP